MEPIRKTRLAAYALILDAGNILLCRLSSVIPKWEGHWTLPGGGVEFGESPEQAMIREVEEETGLHVRALSIAGIDTKCNLADGYHGVRIVYHVEVTGGELRHEISGSTDRCQWHPLDGVREMDLADLVEAVIRWQWNIAYHE